MTTQDIRIEFARNDWRPALDRFLAERAHGMNGYMLCRRRLDSLIRLNALSDAELGQLGLTRDTLPAFVFEDVLPG